MTFIVSIFKKFIIQIIGIVLGLIVLSIGLVIFGRSILWSYGRWLAVPVMILCVIVIPLRSLWQIKSALIESTGSYVANNYEDTIIGRVTNHYTKHISNNNSLQSSITTTKNFTQSLPGIARRIMDKLIEQVPIFGQIVRVVGDFNPINLTDEQIKHNLTARIHKEFEESELTQTTVRSVYKMPLLVVISIWIALLLLHFYPMIIS